jgi:hypothetical protein
MPLNDWRFLLSRTTFGLIRYQPSSAALAEFKYRIKSPREPHERMAMENDLRSLAPA